MYISIFYIHNEYVYIDIHVCIYRYFIYIMNMYISIYSYVSYVMNMYISIYSYVSKYLYTLFWIIHIYRYIRIQYSYFVNYIYIYIYIYIYYSKCILWWWRREGNQYISRVGNFWYDDWLIIVILFTSIGDL